MMKKTNFTQISVIVPIYNVENYLKRCLDSLLCQTFKNIEIICIDDASTDNSGKILDAYAGMDTRVRPYHFRQNAGTLCARLKGMQTACGEFVMFVDSDDALEPDACEKLLHVIMEQRVDVLHFGTILHAAKDVSAQMLAWVTEFLKPLEERVEGNLHQACFVKGRFDFNITNKIWRSTVIRQALPYIKKQRLSASEDRYCAFLLLYFAHSYYGMPHAFYHYYLGIGVTGGDLLSMEQFEKRCTGAAASELVLQFFIQMGEDGADEKECAKQFGRQIVWDCVDCWHQKLLPEQWRYGFQILCRYFQPDQLAAAVARVYFEQEEDIYGRILLKQGMSTAIYDRYLNAEDLIHGPVSQCIRDLRRLGYEVYLYTDEERRQELLKGQANEYGVQVFYLPDAREANWGNYEKRAEQFYARIKKDRICMVLYLSPSSHTAWLDLLLAQLAGAQVCRLRDKEQFCREKQLRQIYEQQRQAYEQQRQAYEQLEADYQKLYMQFDSPRILLRLFFKRCWCRLYDFMRKGRS